MDEITSRVKRAYDEWAAIYDTNENPTRDLNYKTIRQESLELANKKVLEIGCGTGLNTTYLAKQAQKVVAVDLSEKMLDKACRRLKTNNVDFVPADITQTWSFEDHSFDLIVGNLVLEHIDDLLHVFREGYRVLEPDGKFYIAELHPYKQLHESQAKFTSKKTGKEVLVEAFEHSVSEYINKGLDAGFCLKKIREWKSENEKIPRLLTLLFEKSRDK